MLNHIEYVKDLQMVARRNRAEGELPCSRAKSCCPIEFIILCSSLRVILSIDRQGRYLHAPIGLKAFNRVAGLTNIGWQRSRLGWSGRVWSVLDRVLMNAANWILFNHITVKDEWPRLFVISVWKLIEVLEGASKLDKVFQEHNPFAIVSQNIALEATTSSQSTCNLIRTQYDLERLRMSFLMNGFAVDPFVSLSFRRIASDCADRQSCGRKIVWSVLDLPPKLQLRV